MGLPINNNSRTMSRTMPRTMLRSRFGLLIAFVVLWFFQGPASGYTAGRFTDGTDTVPAAHNYNGVWVEQLAALLRCGM